MNNVPRNSLQAVTDLRGAYIKYLEDMAAEAVLNGGDTEQAEHIRSHIPEMQTCNEQELLAHIAVQFEFPIEWIFEVWSLDD